MTNEILKIRAKQLFRVMVEIGIFRAIFLLILVCFGLLAVFTKLSEDSNKGIIIGLFALSVFLIHLKRKDKIFIKIHAANPQIVFFTEYFLLSLPLLITLAYYSLFSYVFVYISFLSIIPVVNINTIKTSVNSRFQRMIPDYNFEWKAGIRRNLIPFVGIWIIGIASSFFVASVPIAIFFLGVIIISFYEKPESLQILLSDELNTRKFLTKKILNHLMIYSITIIPLIIFFLIFNPEYYFIPLIEFVIFVILIVYTILLKYAFYRPDNKSGAAQIFSMIGIISVFIPFFIFLVLILSIKFLFQAITNLNFHLNDYN